MEKIEIENIEEKLSNTEIIHLLIKTSKDCRKNLRICNERMLELNVDNDDIEDVRENIHILANCVVDILSTLNDLSANCEYISALLCQSQTEKERLINDGK